MHISCFYKMVPYEEDTLHISHLGHSRDPLPFEVSRGNSNPLNQPAVGSWTANLHPLYTLKPSLGGIFKIFQAKNPSRFNLKKGHDLKHCLLISLHKCCLVSEVHPARGIFAPYSSICSLLYLQYIGEY